ncbi:MAG: hypothetical protein WDK96_00395 [Candidatus Paceibacterota bacterium]|jgi:hypothetical protein
MGIFSSSKTTGELAAIFDIGSGSVSGSLVLLSKNNSTKPDIIFFEEERISTKRNFDLKNFELEMLKSLSNIALSMQKSRLGNPKKIFCFLASPWCVSQTRIIKMERNLPFTFTNKLASDLIEKEDKIFESSQLNKYKDFGEKMRVIESNNMQVSLNGYQTTNPVNQKAKELEMKIFVTISPEILLKSIENKIQTVFNSPIKFFSFILSSFVLTRDIFADNKDFLLVDVAGEITDISIIKDDALLESLSFPFGKNNFIRKIATALNKGEEETMSLLNICRDNVADDIINNKMQIEIDKAKKEWLDYFQGSLVELSNNFSIPKNIFITIDNDICSHFESAIKNEEFNQYMLTENKFNVIVLKTSIFSSFCNFKEDVKRNQFLMLESIFVNRINK